MLKVGDKVVIADGQEWFDKKEYKTITGMEVAYNLDNSSIAYNEKMLKLYKEEKKMEKTFREVIRDIKKGEVWESEFKIIKMNGWEEIIITEKTNEKDTSMLFNKVNLYKLRREKADFQTALKAYEEGKEIESWVSERKFYLVHYDDDFTYQEIKGEWYIN